MGNSGLTKLWESNEARNSLQSENSESEIKREARNSLQSENSESEIKREAERSSTESLEYRSAQGESFSDEDKHTGTPYTNACTFPIDKQDGLQCEVKSQCVETTEEDKIRNNIPKEVLEAHYDDMLLDVTHPCSLATDLLVRQMITQDVGSAMLSDDLTHGEKMIVLMDAMLKVVSEQPSEFHVLIKILEKKPAHHSVAALLKESYTTLTSGGKITSFTYSSVILEYAADLKAFYRNRSLPHMPYGSSTNVFNLKVKTNDIKNVRNKCAIYQTSAFKSLEKSFIKVDPINYTEIFDSTKCFLVEGDRCIGKTELVWTICQKWEEIPALRKFHLILLLDLKNKHVQEAKTIQDIFYHHNSHVRQKIVQEIEKAKGKQILIILDGFEQLPCTVTQNHESFFVKIVMGKILPKSIKFITATPSTIRNIISSYELIHVKHIEVLGFHAQQALCFSQAVDPHGFHEYFSANIGLLYLPLTLSMVINFHQDRAWNNIPQRLTHYFSRYCLDLICNNFLESTNPEIKQKPPCSLQDLDSDTRKHLLSISKIALEGIINKEISCNDLCPSNDFVHLGLMSTSCPHCRDSILELRFLNHRLQEFLAAYYISQLDDYEKDHFFLNHSFNKMHNVWRFFAGLTHLTYTIIEVLKFSIDDERYLVFITSLLCEQQDEVLIGDIFGDSDIVNYSLSYHSESKDVASACYALGYCIAASNCSWNLNLGSCNLKTEDLQALQSGINSIKVVSGSINALQLDQNLITIEKLHVLSVLPISMLENIINLNFNSCNLTQQAFDFLATNLIPSMPRLQVLNIGNNHKHSYSNMSQLLVTLTSLTELQDLNLDNTALGFEDMVHLHTLLSMTGTSLTQLSIGGKDMLLETIYLLIDTVLSQSLLEGLHISDFDLTKSADTMALLETNTTLTRLILFECKMDVTHISTSLCMNTTLRELDIFFPLSNDKYDIGLEATTALTDMLEVNRSLSRLSLYSYKPLEQSRVISLVETLNYNRSLQCLQLPEHFARSFSVSAMNLIDSRVCWKEWPCIAINIE